MQRDDETRKKIQNRKKRLQNREAVEKRIRSVKLYSMTFIFFICFVYLSYRIISIKFIHGEEYERQAKTQLINKSSMGEQLLNPNRGSIVDRNMQDMAVSSIVYDIFIDVRRLINRDNNYNPKSDEPKIIDESIRKINEILQIPVDELQVYLQVAETIYTEDDRVKEKKPSEQYDTHHLVIKKDVPYALAKQLEELSPTDVYLDPKSIRSYINNNIAANVIGFIRGDASYGLERRYNSYLTGVPGRVYRKYSGGGGTIEQRIEPEEGKKVVTTIDLSIQKIAEDVVLKWGEAYNAKNASVIVMDPDTGEILAMAEYPSFDLNQPAKVSLITKAQYRDEWKDLDNVELITKLESVWQNYNINSTFEPGSIYKPLTIAAALEENIISTSNTYGCPGYKIVSDFRINCHEKRGHGLQTLDEALANSCNVALMDIGEQMGRDLFFNYQKDFGYGEKTGIDLPETEKGLLFSRSGLNTVELATSAFGQRFKCTPIQAITSFATIINGGNLVKPYFVSQVVGNDGTIVYENKPTVIRKVISQETSDYLRTKMEKVVQPQYTGRKAAIDGYAIGGKTGTGEQGIRGTEDYHHTLSFIAYFPVKNPQYLVMTLINDPDATEAEIDNGTVSVGPVMREVIQGIIDLKKIPPSYDLGENASVNSDDGKIVLEDYIGQPLPQVTKSLNGSALNYELIGGNGTHVTAQAPLPGAKVSKDTTLILTIKNDDPAQELIAVPALTGLPQSQAEELLLSLNLIPRIEIDAVRGSTPEEHMENASGPEASNNQNSDPTSGNSEEGIDKNSYTVYKQMIEPDVKVPVGTEIKIRVQQNIPSTE